MRRNKYKLWSGILMGNFSFRCKKSFLFQNALKLNELTISSCLVTSKTIAKYNHHQRVYSLFLIYLPTSLCLHLWKHLLILLRLF
jgi:hypothetical protein